MKTPHLLSNRIVPFTALLGAFEILLVWYWVSLRLGQVLLYGAILAPFTVFAGKTALLAMSERRLAPAKK
jgi:oligosaccharyltransferase complex subunit delta (ribophorin II)